MKNTNDESVNISDNSAKRCVMSRASRTLLHPNGYTVTETYDTEVNGSCSCGAKVTKVINSSFTCRRDKVRYRDTGDLDEGWCMFRCRKCEEVIEDTWHCL